MGKAQDWKAFERQLKTLQVPTFNIVPRRPRHVLISTTASCLANKTGGDIAAGRAGAQIMSETL
jgi:hypothetical protein